MVRLTSSKLLPLQMIIRQQTRKINKYAHRNISSKVIRQNFLDFFITQHDHRFVRSSPVVPLCDPTVAFVNAGMNQFKGIFLGNQEPIYPKAVNSQKCVRVGGKHNDLNVVGTDGYHHTFFEMLGSWSFGDYFKNEACSLAWELLTQIYKIPPNRLYVTYFKGDKSLGLEEDFETKEIWKQLGVPTDRILPYGQKDNFWEMGTVGPCGPCTEIHFDHRGKHNRANFVNRGLHDLTEIWNIVFIEFNRDETGAINILPKRHIDTGIGFERLTAVLQGKVSNYDTDNFSYLLSAIQKICSGINKYTGKFGENDWNNLDTSYRILADHTRMITACLADGMIPEENQKLRRIMRKVFLLSETVFKKDNGLLRELSNFVVDHLGPVYPEMEKNIHQIHQIINYEEDVFRLIRKNIRKHWQKLTAENPKLTTVDIVESPSVIAAYKELCTVNDSKLSPQMLFKLYDTYGIDDETITKLCNCLQKSFDLNDLKNELEKAKVRSKDAGNKLDNKIAAELIGSNINRTNDKYKYDYEMQNDGYNFNPIEVKLLKIVKDNEFVSEIKDGTYCSLLLDKTNLYSEAGGQSSDKGVINFKQGSFEVVSTQNQNGYILHSGSFTGENLEVNETGMAQIDGLHRLHNMQNHTGIHLLNAVLKNTKGATCQKSSKVTNNCLNLDVAIFGNKLSMTDVVTVETIIDDLINSRLDVNVKEVNSQEFLEMDKVTTIPGEIYPDTGIRVVEICKDGDYISREPCCGTHVFNTADLDEFCIIGLKSLGRSTTSITAVTGDRAQLAKSNAIEMKQQINNLQTSLKENVDTPEQLEMVVTNLKQKLNFDVLDTSILPIYVKQECLEKLDVISKQIKDSQKGNLRNFIEMEMQNALESKIRKTKTNQKYIIHYLRSSMILESVPLQRATKICPDLPILVIAYADNTVKARCCVPKDNVTENFNAEKWLKETVADVFKSKTGPPKGQDGLLVCNMKAKKVHLQEWDTLLNESLKRAENYIENNL